MTNQDGFGGFYFVYIPFECFERFKLKNDGGSLQMAPFNDTWLDN